MEYREFSEPLEIRSASQRLVCGRLVPYGHDQRITDTLTVDEVRAWEGLLPIANDTLAPVTALFPAESDADTNQALGG